MIKAQWNTVILDGSVPQGEIERMIGNSFMLIVSKMSKKEQQSVLLHHQEKSTTLFFLKMVKNYHFCLVQMH